MSLLLDDLLDISRITRGTLELRLEDTELADILEAAVETARPVIDAKGINSRLRRLMSLCNLWRTRYGSLRS